MATRQTITTQGKHITFEVDNNYYVIGNNDKSAVFNGGFKNSKFCVCYTKVCYDSGFREETRWGSPTLVGYDNGNVGYQCMNFFNDKKEAIKDYNGRLKLSPKMGIVAYCDVFLVENN